MYDSPITHIQNNKFKSSKPFRTPFFKKNSTPTQEFLFKSIYYQCNLFKLLLFHLVFVINVQRVAPMALRHISFLFFFIQPSFHRVFLLSKFVLENAVYRTNGAQSGSSNHLLLHYVFYLIRLRVSRTITLYMYLRDF